MMTFDLLVSDLYAAANGRGEWSRVLGNIAAFLDLWTVQVLGIDKKNGHLMFSVHGGQATPQTALDYFRLYHSIDPRVGLAASTPPDQWFHCHEHFDDEFVEHNDFYQQFLIPHGGRYASGTVLIDNEDVIFLLAMLRAHGSRPLTQADLGVMNGLKHHFTEAMRNLVHMRETFAEIGMARELLNQLRYPMLLVDATRGIWHRNEAAAALLDSGKFVIERAGVLACRDKSGDDALTEALYSCQLPDAGSQTSMGRRVVALRAADGAICLAFVSNVQPARTMGAFGAPAQALVVLHDLADTHSALDPFIVAECFNFTPAEARVAVQVASGANAKEIAQRTGAALATVRTHLQHVMEKAGVDRQADLIRALLALPTRS